MSAPRFGRDARNHRLEAGSTLRHPFADGDKLSPPLGISELNWIRFGNADAAETSENLDWKADMPF